MDNRIEYLNTDLDLVSSVDLSSLAAAFESRGAPSMHVTHGEDGLWHAAFETERDYDEPDANIAAMLDVVESLPAELADIWMRCDRREFNIGYDCGEEPWAFQQGVSSETLGRMAAARASLRWTLYPDRSAVDGAPQSPEASS